MGGGPATAQASGSSPVVRVLLGHACVVPGYDQTITITVTVADAPASVSYSAHYADGELGMDDGGVGIGRTDSSGVYRGEWQVSPKSPLGDAYVMAGASRNGMTWTAAPVHFTVASHC